MKNKKRVITLAIQLLCAAVLVLIDLLIKQAAVKNLAGKEDIILIKNFLALSYAENTGAAFSMFSNSTNMLSFVTAVLMVVIVVVLAKGVFSELGRYFDVCLVMILAGGAGNLVDRLVNGYVVDYIKTLFIDFPVFNFADILVVCGSFVIMFGLIYSIIKDEKRKKAAKSDGNS